jgi:hypothetical protein
MWDLYVRVAHHTAGVQSLADHSGLRMLKHRPRGFLVIVGPVCAIRNQHTSKPYLVDRPSSLVTVAGSATSTNTKLRGLYSSSGR